MSTLDDDSLLAAVNIELTSIAEASRTPPLWYGDWKRLGPESTEEERLVVYQAIRDSGCLPLEAGFCLVSGQVEIMANLETGPTRHASSSRRTSRALRMALLLSILAILCCLAFVWGLLFALLGAIT